MVNEAEEFATELDKVCTKFFKRDNLCIYDFLMQVSLIYATLVRMAEEGVNEKELIAIRDDAVNLVADQIYKDGLLDENNFRITH
jgi:hypothetical protein